MCSIKRLRINLVYILGLSVVMAYASLHPHKSLAQYTQQFARTYPRTSKAIAIILPIVGIVGCTIATSKEYNHYCHSLQKPWQLIFSFGGALSFGYLAMKYHHWTITHNILYYLDSKMTYLHDQSRGILNQASMDNDTMTTEMTRALLIRSKTLKPMQALRDTHIASSIVPAHVMSASYLFLTYGVITPFGWTHTIIALKRAYDVGSKIMKR